MYGELGQGKLNARIVEGLIHCHQELVFDFKTLPEIDKRSQFKLQRILTEFQQQDLGSRVFQDFRVLIGNLKENPFDLLDTGVIFHANGDFESSFRIGQSPVDESFGHKFLVGDNHFTAIPETNGGGPDLSSSHDTLQRSDLDRISDPDGSFQLQN